MAETDKEGSNVVVVKSPSKIGLFFGAMSKRLKWSRPFFKRYKWPILVVIVLVAFFFVYPFVRNYNLRSVYQTGSCNVTSNQACTLLNQAAGQLDQTKVLDLGNTVGQIQKLKGYKKDPNLMYVVTIYYINLGDSNNAHSAYATFTSIYNSKNGYDQVLAPVALSPDGLKKSIEFVDQENNAVIKNSSLIQEPK